MIRMQESGSGLRDVLVRAAAAIWRPSLLALVAAFSMLIPAQAQQLSFTLHEHVVIGDDEEASAAHLFYFPELVRTDSQGNIYVKDARSAEVRVFDAGGRFVTTIGKRGAGPGEMREIYGMHVDGNDRLIVADRMSRRFTIFTDLGQSFQIKSTQTELTLAPNPILSLNDSFLLTYVELFANPEGGPSIQGDKYLHVHDKELNRLESFATLDDIYNLEVPFLEAYSDSPRAVHVATNGVDVVVLAPNVYEGTIYRYTRAGGSWVMQRLRGGPVPRRSFMPVRKADFDTNPDIKRGAVMLSRPSGTYFARTFSESRGLAILSTGEILHFPFRTPLRKNFEPWVELFGRDGTLLGYGPLQFDDPELNGDARIMKSINIQWIDADDRLYIARTNREGFYVLSVARLEIGS